MYSFFNPKRKIYLAGPMSGLPNFNRDKFNVIDEIITEKGHTVLNPAKLPDGLTEPAYMMIGVTMLQCCDCIFMLPNWEGSRGAVAEHALAQKIGLKVIYLKDNLTTIYDVLTCEL